MRLNGYSVRVIGGDEDSSAYVDMRHGQTYQLQLRNDNPKRCDARVEIDGRYVNTWRIDANQGITVEKTDNNAIGKFTFFHIGTPESRQSQLNQDDPSLGIIKVTFTPEVNVRPLVQDFPVYGTTPDWFTAQSKGITFNTTAASTYSTPVSLGNTRSAGGTGLSGHSDQHFGVAAQIEYDYSGQTVIHLRLVCKEDDGIRPLTQFSTPVPPRIG